jgi:hypothetical protein
MVAGRDGGLAPVLARGGDLADGAEAGVSNFHENPSIPLRPLAV